MLGRSRSNEAGRRRPGGRVLALAALVVLTVAATSACSDIEPAATVDGDPVSAPFAVDEQVAAVLESATAEAEELDLFTPLPEGPTGPGDAEASISAALVTTAVYQEIVRDELEERDADVHEDDLDEAELAFSPYPTAELPDTYVDALVQSSAEQIALNRLLAEDEPVTDADVRREYRSYPELYPEAICGSMLVVPDQDLADRVVARWWDEGDTFEEILADVEADPALRDPRNGDFGCLTLTETYVELGGPVAASVAYLYPDEISEPITVEASDGGTALAIAYVAVIEPKPFDEVQDLIRDDLESAQEGLVFDWMARAVARADVEVDPRYGTWDEELLQVVPPGWDDDEAPEIY